MTTIEQIKQLLENDAFSDQASYEKFQELTGKLFNDSDNSSAARSRRTCKVIAMLSA